MAPSLPLAGNAGAIDMGLLPLTATIAVSGRMTIGACDLVALAHEFGTPLFVYDEEHLRTRCREYRARFDHVAYAGKAFLCRAMAALVSDEGLHLDVATGGELHVARAAGVPADRIVFHGNNKSEAELELALAEGVGRIVVDSFNEIERLRRLVAAGAPAPLRLLIRVTPGVEAHTHEYIETGTEDSKFGFSIATGAALSAAHRVVDAELPLVGLHCHIGSQIMVLQSYARAAAIVAGFAAQVVATTGVTIEELNLGGGLGAPYVSGERAPSVDEYADIVDTAFTGACTGAGLAPPALFVEPGRSIAANAAVTLYTVGTVKEIVGGRTYVAVDGGMSDNLRPATYGARYEAFVPARASAPRTRVVTVAGKHCEQGDLLVRDAAVPADIAVGDILCTPATGAYGYAMANNYNKVTRPAVVFVKGGEPRLVVRRETLDDLLGLDVG